MQFTLFSSQNSWPLSMKISCSLDRNSNLHLITKSGCSPKNEILLHSEEQNSTIIAHAKYLFLQLSSVFERRHESSFYTCLLSYHEIVIAASARCLGVHVQSLGSVVVRYVYFQVGPTKFWAKHLKAKQRGKKKEIFQTS